MKNVLKNRQVDKMRKEEQRNRKQIDNEGYRNGSTPAVQSQKQILFIGIIIIAFGIIAVLFSIILSEFYVATIDENKGMLKKWVKVGEELTMCIGTTTMAIGAGTALYSYFDFVNYVQEKLKRVIIDFDFTDIMSDEEKKVLAYKLEKEILHHTEGNNLYDFVQDEVLSLAKRAFYEEFTLNVACEKVGSEICKTIYKDYIINCKAEPGFDISENNEFIIKCKESCEKDPADNIKLTINNIEFSKQDYFTKLETTNDEVYNKKCTYTLNEQAKEKIEQVVKDRWDYMYTVKSEMVSTVRDDDMTFSFRLYHPCKNSTFLFTYNPDEFEVMEDVFVFKDTDTDENVKKKAVITRHNKGSIHIKIDNWILPGDGITFVLSPVKKAKEK